MHALASLSLRHARWTLALVAAASIALGLGAARLRTDAGYRAFLGADHPAVRELDWLAARFGGGLPFAAVWSCAESQACASVFDRESLAMAHGVARALEALPGVRRVDGPATSPLLVPDFGFPRARRLAPDGEPAPDLAELAERALRDPLWAGQLVSPDGAAGGLLIHLESSDGDVGARVLGALRRELAPWEARGFRFHLVGGPVEFVVAGAELERKTALLMPVMVALVGAILLALFRSPAPAAVALGSVGVAVVWTLGFQGWLGWPRNSLSQALPPLVLVIGVCDAIHVLAGFASRLARHPGADRRSREALLLEVVRDVGAPCVMTSLTTAAGFASFAASDLESMARFGWVAAFGVCGALVLCFSLLPVLAVRVAPPRASSAASARTWERALAALVALGRRRSGAVLAGAALLAALGAGGMARLRVDARFEDLYGEDSQVVRWARAASRHLRAAETLEIAVEPAPGVAWDSAAALRALDRVEALAELEGLARPLSVLTPLRELHLLLLQRPLVLDGSPKSGEDARRMLRLVALEDPSLVRLFVDREGGALRVSFQAEKLPQDRLRDLLARVRWRLDAELPAGFSARVTGPLATVGRMIDELRRTQLQSFALAGALVLALVAAWLRSPASALLAALPTGLPVVVTLGALGLCGVPLDVGSAMVAAVVLGLAVDGPIHLLAAWRRRRLAGEGADAAIGAAVCEVGRALVTTSLALAAGFLALALVPWKSIASFGLVSGIAILGSLLATLLVLPALIVSLRSGGSGSRPAPP